MTKRAGIYTRISRDREGAGLGVDRQEQDCRELADRLGWPVVATFQDNDLSAYSGKPRPGYLALLDAIRSGEVTAVLVWHTDRLHRSPAELEEYIGICDPRGVPTVTVKAGPLDLSTPSGRMVARQLGAVARYEVEHAIERQQRAKLQAATDGKWRGGRRPFGFEDDGVTVRPDEAAEIVKATEAVLSGASLRSIAADLNRRGILTSTGQKFRQDTIRALLLRARNAGLIEHRGEVLAGVKAAWPAIVDPKVWMAARNLLTDPSRLTHLSSVRRWLGSGLYLCGVCGATVRATVGGVRASQPKTAYMCSKNKHVARTAADVDQVVELAVIKRLALDGDRLLARDAVRDTDELQVEALTLRQHLDDAAAMFGEGVIDARQLRESSERLRRRLEQVEKEIANASRGSVLSGVVGGDVAETWARLDLDRKRSIVNALMTVTLKPTKRGRPPGWRPGQSYFDPSSVQITWKE